MINKRLRRVVSVLRERERYAGLQETVNDALRTGRLQAPVAGAMKPLIRDVRNLGEASAAEVAFALFLVIEDLGPEAWEQLDRWARRTA